MKIANSISQIELQSDSVLTIGTFDGVHRGHQRLIGGMIESARRQNRTSIVLSFHPHPRSVIAPGAAAPPYLTTPEERAAILEKMGLDWLLILPFTQELARTPAEVFVSELYTRLRVRELWVGPDFALGRARRGDVPFLRALGERLGYALHVVEPLLEGGEVISSTRIRLLLQEGRVAEAANLLGRTYTIWGPVISGEQRGRALGFRTANLRLDPNRAIPALGVYAVWVCLGDGPLPEGTHYPAVANVGVHPSFGASAEPLLEVHLMDYEGDLYGKLLGVGFVERLRPEMTFPSAAALVAQIKKDVERTRQLLTPEAPRPQCQDR